MIKTVTDVELSSAVHVIENIVSIDDLRHAGPCPEPNRLREDKFGFVHVSPCPIRHNDETKKSQKSKREDQKKNLSGWDIVKDLKGFWPIAFLFHIFLTALHNILSNLKQIFDNFSFGFGPKRLAFRMIPVSKSLTNSQHIFMDLKKLKREKERIQSLFDSLLPPCYKHLSIRISWTANQTFPWQKRFHLALRDYSPKKELDKLHLVKYYYSE